MIYKNIIKYFILLLFIFIIKCDPSDAKGPGDQASVEWKSTKEIPENINMDCPGNGHHEIIESGVVLEDCIIFGSIRIMAPGIRNGQHAGIESSKTYQHVENLRHIAPSHVKLINVRIIGNGRIPLYIGPGVTFANIDSVEIGGKSDGPLVYFDAESSRNIIINSKLDGSNAARKTIAIDSSDYNEILNSIILGKGIELYRNCGEGGVARHTTPSWNIIKNNKFNNGHIILGSRNGLRSYCGEDEPGNYGSSVSNWDWARFNIVENNSGVISISEGFGASENSIKNN